MRWTDGKAVCPHCGCPSVDAGVHRLAAVPLQGLPQGFQHHQRHAVRVPQAAAPDLPGGDRDFRNEVKGKSALALSRDLDIQYKSAYVLSHKLREAMASEMKGKRIGGVGETVEIDGGYFGGYVKPANHRENRRDLRLVANQSGKRKVVVVMRERDGRTIPAVFKSESAALGFIVSRVEPQTKLMADEAYLME